MRWGLGFLLVVLAAGCKNEKPAASPETEPARPVSSGSERPATLVFGVAPFLEPEVLRQELSPLVEHIGKSVGMPAELRIGKSYADVATLLGAFEVHVAVLPAFAYVVTKREHPDLVLLATEIAQGSSSYSAYIVTRSGAGIVDIDDLRGKQFAFVDRRSTSGYLYPLAFLRKRGIEPETFFSGILFAGNHERVIEMVEAGEVAAGAVYSGALAMRKNRQGAGLEILSKTGRIPHDAYCASGRLDRALVDQLRRTLLALSTRTPEGRRVLPGRMAVNGFAPTTDKHYDEVRRVADLLRDTPLPGAPRAMH